MEEDKTQNLFITTFGRNPKIPEIEFVEQTFIKKFGYEKTKKIFFAGVLKGFKLPLTLWESLDEQGNIRPRDREQKIINSTYQPAYKQEKKLCDCGCGRERRMKIGNYLVFERVCYDSLKTDSSKTATILGDIIKNLGLDNEEK